ncbi:hypothetical protein IH575_01765 [Candidatus Dojkabacteria bacterium]|nr:hypothetical protein [Candidatus Dojkabacteria bacterium]
MPVFREKSDKLNLILSNGSNDVKIKVDCYYGTQVSVSFYHKSLVTLSCGNTKKIENSNSLKGKSITFNGAANNPNGGQIKIIHTIWEENGNSIEYAIPEDFSGEIAWDSNNINPSYEFQVNFI